MSVSLSCSRDAKRRSPRDSASDQPSRSHRISEEDGRRPTSLGGNAQKSRARVKLRKRMQQYKITRNGYAAVHLPNHPKADKKAGYVYEHVIVAERALGKSLPPRAEIHHFNEQKTDNKNSNLVICPSRAYHFLLHQRLRALRACGNPNYLRCVYCKQYDSPSRIRVQFQTTGSHGYHHACKAKYDRMRRRRKQ